MKQSDKEIDAWIVMYRGNGYGLFLSEQIANEFAEFIAERNEKKFGTNQVGEYQPTIIKTTIEDGLQARKRKDITYV